ncbi:MAG: sugar transferase [Bacteroidales bacterium]|nr:sugar transferase [Bacteroidales bacterium]
MKRLFDFILSLLGLIALTPILVPIIIIIWLQDWHSPFYIAPRVGRGGRVFNMVKLRSMVINAEKSGVDSTSSNDTRITKVGKFIRKYKLDEISQIINVLIGDMSIVGPRPNVKRETDLYTEEERKLLSLKPGITDFSSIVFSDEGDILKDYADPDIAYNQLIRPWKSRLGIFYINNHSMSLDIKLIYITIIAIVSREKALFILSKILEKAKADEDLINVSSRRNKLIPTPPPGSDNIVINRRVKNMPTNIM